VRWYINEISLQGQFPDTAVFEALLRTMLATRARIDHLRANLRMTRNLSERPVTSAGTVRSVLQQSRNRDLRGAVLAWFDHTGPFIDDDRQEERDDYFEYAGVDVTDGGLGEAARRVKIKQGAATFSFTGGAINFALSPLRVDHGLAEERFGEYFVDNCWTLEGLTDSALGAGPPITSWRILVDAARQKYPRLLIPDAVHQNPMLVREPFEAVIRDRALTLLGHLDTYMAGRGEGGAEDADARLIIQKFFTGERALFTGESPTNQQKFRSELTFSDPDRHDCAIFAHWHGKISHRFFRMHFEWPVPVYARKLKVLYLGPKLTKD
jgi:hypothetical protein